METIIENKTILTKKIVYKAARLYYNNTYRVFRIFFLIGGLFCAFMATATIIYGGINATSIKATAGTALILSFYFISYLPVGWQLYSNIKALNPSCEEFYKFYDGEMENINPNAYRKDMYPQIRQVIISKDLYILMLGRHVLFIVDRNAFTKGTDGDFMNFVLDKFHGRIRKM